MTLQELKDRRAAYLAAELRILESQEYRVGDGGTGRTNRRAELAEVRAAITELDAQISAAEAGTAAKGMWLVGTPSAGGKAPEWQLAHCATTVTLLCSRAGSQLV